MTSSILNFFEARDRGHAAEAPRGWTNQELAEFYRVADSLSQAGLPVDTDFGLSDEGEPWFAFYHPDTADVVAHFARIDGRFVAAGAALHEVVDGRDLREIIDRLLRTRPLMMPIGNGRGGGNLLLHPAIVLTAFVATALFSMQEAEAAPLGNGEGGTRHTAAGSAEKPAKAAPTLIQKLLAGAGGETSNQKHNTAEALSQGLQQAALQAAIGFAIAQLPAGIQAMQAGDLLDTMSSQPAQAAALASAVAVQSLSDFAGTAQKQAVVAAQAELGTAPVAAHADSASSAVIAITPTAAVTSMILPALEQVLVAHHDAATENAVKATTTLLDLLREVAQTLPQHAPTQAAVPAEAAVAKTESAPAIKTYEVTLTVDTTHSAFLQSQLFKELLRAQAIDVSTDAARGGSDGTVTIKLTFESKEPAPASTMPDPSLPSTVPDVAGIVPVAAPSASAAPTADVIVKTGIAIYDQIIDFTFHAQADGSDALAQALRDVDNANGHLLAGAKRIVLFDSHDLSLQVYRISDDVVMVDRAALHLDHDQAAAGHTTMAMSLPNGGSVELLGVLAPPPGLF
jgi:hypothetical protein